MPPQVGVISQQEIWLDDQGNKVNPPNMGFDLGPWQNVGGSNVNAKKHVLTIYENGEYWDSVDGAPATYVKTDAQIASNYRSQNKNQTAPSAWPTSAIITDPATGQPVPNPYAAQGSEPKGSQWTDPNTGAEYLINPNTGEVIRELSGPIPGYVPGRGVPTPPSAPQRAPRYPDEEELAQLNVQKARQDLMDPYSLASQQRAEVLKTLTDQMSQGLIDETQANQTLKLWDDKTNAALQGTTPWAQETQKQNLSRNLMSDQVQAGTSLAPHLLNAAMSMYDKALPNNLPMPTFDYFAEWQRMQNALPGAGLSKTAEGLLQGALGGNQ